MKFVVNAKQFADELKRMRPKGRKVGSRNYPLHVQVTAGGSVIVVLSELACSASLPAVVSDAGTSKFPHESGLNVLKTYKKGATVELKFESDCVWIDQLRLPLAHTR